MLNFKNFFTRKLNKKSQNTSKEVTSTFSNKDTLNENVIIKSGVVLGEEIKTDSSLVGVEVPSGVSDDDKRLFLKIAGVAGLGLAASALFPKSADAYVAGSTPTSNVVGMKNIANAKINPATEDTLGLIKTNSDKFLFDASGNLLTASTGDSAVSVVGVKNASDLRINPVQDDTVILLRRMVKLMESQAVVDTQMRQRITVDVMPSVTVSGSLTSAGTVSTVSTVTSLNQIAGVDSRWQIIDWSRQAYNSGIRNNLINL